MDSTDHDLRAPQARQQATVSDNYLKSTLVDPGLPKEETSFMCHRKTCGKPFGNERGLRTHQTRPHGPKRDSSDEYLPSNAARKKRKHNQSENFAGKTLLEPETADTGRSSGTNFTEEEAHVILTMLTEDSKKRSIAWPQFFCQDGQLKRKYDHLNFTIRELQDGCEGCQQQLRKCETHSTLENRPCTACQNRGIECSRAISYNQKSVHQGKSQSQEQSRLKTSGIAVEIDNTKDSTNSNSGFIPSRGRIPADSESLDELDGNQPSNGLVRYTATSANFADRKGDVNSNAIGRTANRATPDGLMMINLRPSVIRFGHEILDDDSLIQAFDNLTACIDQYVLHYIVSEPERWLLKDTNRVHGNNLIPHHVPILRRIFGVPIGVPIKQKIFHLEPDDTLPTKLVVRGLLAYIVQEIVFRKSSIFPDDSILANILQEVGNPEVRSILIQEHRFRLQLRDPELRKRIAQVNEDDLKRLNQVMACVISSDPDTQGRHRELAKLANELNARISSYTRAKWTCIWATHGTNFNPAIHELYESMEDQKLSNRKIFITVVPGILCTLMDGSRRTTLPARVSLVPEART